MAGQPRRRSNLVRVKSDRTSVWIGTSVAVSTVAANTVVLLATLNAAALALRPFTVVRTRLLLHWESDQSASSEQATGAFGAIVVTAEAAAAGVASVPDPVGDPSSPWFVWQPLSTSFLFADATGFIEPAGNDYEVDSKSMRKVGLNEDIALVAEETNVKGALISSTGRMLVKLH